MIPTKDVVTVERAGTLDDWGRPTGETTEDFSCRVDYRTEVIKTDTGEEAVSKAIILIKGVAQVTNNDTVKWSDDYGDHEAQPLSVSPLKDLSSKVLFTKVVV
jgi:hypothetical protein